MISKIIASCNHESQDGEYNESSLHVFFNFVYSHLPHDRKQLGFFRKSRPVIFSLLLHFFPLLILLALPCVLV